MELKIKIETGECSNCDLSICDVTPVSNSGYLNENFIGYSQNKFKYSETVGLVALRANATSGARIEYKKFLFHEKSLDRNVTFENVTDNWYTISYLVMPSLTWFSNQIKMINGELDGEVSLHLYDVVFFSDGSKIWKWVNGANEASIITIEELLNESLASSTLSKVCLDYVSICNLTKCFLSLAKKMLIGQVDCSLKSKLNSDDIFRRDMVWMALNVVKYSVEFCQLTEAQRILELIGGCNGICKSVGSSVSTSGCGCS